MKIISYEEVEKRLVELDKIANIKEEVYLTALKFAIEENRNLINNVNFQIYILFINELQIDFDHEYNDKYCKFEITSNKSNVTITASLFKNRDTEPKVLEVEMKEIFSTVNNFFK